jgi:hypothetical protein
MPAGMLLANESHQPAAVTSGTANLYKVEQASNLFDQMGTLALKVRRETARLQEQGIVLNWREHSARLARAGNDINTIGNDLEHLNAMRSGLEPWQKNLIREITPEIHEIVYQTDEAMNTLNAHENRFALAMTQYPQNIKLITKNANQMADTINTVTQYARVEKKMAALNHRAGTQSGS